MEYDISLSEDGNYIILMYKGDIDGEIALKATMEANELAKKIEVSCILVDAVESRNLDSVINNYDYAYEKLRDVPINKQMLVALLVEPDDHSHDFIETLMINTGHNLKLFRDREQAIQHLMSS